MSWHGCVSVCSFFYKNEASVRCPGTPCVSVLMRFCIVCALFVGTFLAFGKAQQRPCSYGRFREVASQLCVSCAPNHVLDEGLRASNLPNPCVCRNGFEIDASQSECTMCPPGKKALQNEACTLCAKGTFASFSGETSCTECLSENACSAPGCTHCEDTLQYSNIVCHLPQRKIQPGDDFSLFKT